MSNWAETFNFDSEIFILNLDSAYLPSDFEYLYLNNSEEKKKMEIIIIIIKLD